MRGPAIGGEALDAQVVGKDDNDVRRRFLRFVSSKQLAAWEQAYTKQDGCNEVILVAILKVYHPPRRIYVFL